MPFLANFCATSICIDAGLATMAAWGFVAIAASIDVTHLYKSNLSHQMLKDYLGDLISKGFVEFNINKKGGQRYSLTDKGFKYLSDYYVIREFENSYGLN